MAGPQVSSVIPVAAAVDNPRDFWSRLTPQQQEALTHNRGGKIATFVDDSIPLAATKVAIVMDGWVRSGGETGPLRMYGPGEVIGVSALLGSARLDYTCLHSYAKLLILPAEQFSSFLHATRHYLTLMATEDSRRAEADRLRALTGTATHRLAGFLAELTRPEHQPIEARHGRPMLAAGYRWLTQQDLASWSGMSLRSLQRGLAELEEEEIILFGGFGVAILDHDRLRRVAGIEVLRPPAKAVRRVRTPVPF